MTETLTETVIFYTKDGKPRSKRFRRASQAALFVAGKPTAYEKHTVTTVIETLAPAPAIPAE